MSSLIGPLTNATARNRNHVHDVFKRRETARFGSESFGHNSRDIINKNRKYEFKSTGRLCKPVVRKPGPLTILP